ncbi:uncharacterized protein LOC109709599 [Ananas comosus]|uniref:Uncharacterized protein LOC109709599 n=2 Tax=Ananas comosus TaxID=4615 RepID=A0A6P5F1W4_ANACO|nr:uncharacterized protein LOC109709599 [Ananas comosus]CAD1819372.1 unnamed protein product [Ananas comosus var. bracteatus]
MDHTNYWFLTRRKLSKRPLLGPYNESWEEQAFAEDSAGLLGGCIWPPRSYTCSFCGREFRSAQALGGHMNVHRRDRARLKQSSSPTHENQYESLHNHQISPFAPYAPQVGSLVYNSSPNPNPNPNSACGMVASPLSPTEASAVFAKRIWREHMILMSPSDSPSVIQDKQKGSVYSTIQSNENPRARQLLNVTELSAGKENSKLRVRGSWMQRDLGEEEDDEFIPSKRRRTDPVPPLFARSSSGERRKIFQPEVLKLCPSPVEELDLELRLGDPPKVT